MITLSFRCKINFKGSIFQQNNFRCRGGHQLLGKFPAEPSCRWNRWWNSSFPPQFPSGSSWHPATTFSRRTSSSSPVVRSSSWNSTSSEPAATSTRRNSSASAAYRFSIWLLLNFQRLWCLNLIKNPVLVILNSTLVHSCVSSFFF